MPNIFATSINVVASPNSTLLLIPRFTQNVTEEAQRLRTQCRQTIGGRTMKPFSSGPVQDVEKLTFIFFVRYVLCIFGKLLKEENTKKKSKQI